MATTKDKVVWTLLAAGCLGQTLYGLNKEIESVIVDAVEEEPCEEGIKISTYLKTAGKGILVGIGYAGGLMGTVVLGAFAYAMWSEK